MINDLTEDGIVRVWISLYLYLLDNFWCILWNNARNKLMI